MRRLIIVTRVLGLTLIVAMALLLSACNVSISTVNTGALQTYPIEVIQPQGAQAGRPTEVQIDIGSASTLVTVAANDKLLAGTVETNVPDWKPQVIHTAGGMIQVRQVEFNGIPPLNSQNDWHLKIGQGMPLSLTVNAGAVKGEWELGGLILAGFRWKQGAADTTIRFSSPNQSLMNSMSVDAGASNLRLLGLANTGTDSIRINMAAGTLNMRFDGALTRNMTVTVDGGAAAITIDSGGNQIEVVTGQSMSAVTRGDWLQDADTYQSPEWTKDTQPKITVLTKLAASSLNLVNGR